MTDYDIPEEMDIESLRKSIETNIDRTRHHEWSGKFDLLHNLKHARDTLDNMIESIEEKNQ